MSEDIKGVFVRLPLSEGAVDQYLRAIHSGEPLEAEASALEAGLLAIGTPVTGGDIPVAAYTSQYDIDRVRKGKSGDIYGAKNWEGSDEEVFSIPLIRQSDAQAQIAALEAEVVRLREAMEEAQGYARKGSWAITHVTLHKALKGGAA